MSEIPLRCVVDTNVATTANGANDSASATCMAFSARALHAVMKSGHVFLDDGGKIVEEYRRNLSASGEPGPGDIFFKWILTHEWGTKRVTRVPTTPKAENAEDSFELPPPPAGISYDPSDRKFLAVAFAHADHPPILQSLDSKWWGWQEALARHGVSIHFLCPDEIAAKHATKMGGADGVL